MKCERCTTAMVVESVYVQEQHRSISEGRCPICGHRQYPLHERRDSVIILDLAREPELLEKLETCAAESGAGISAEVFSILEAFFLLHRDDL